MQDRRAAAHDLITLVYNKLTPVARVELRARIPGGPAHVVDLEKGAALCHRSRRSAPSRKDRSEAGRIFIDAVEGLPVLERWPSSGGRFLRMKLSGLGRLHWTLKAELALAEAKESVMADHFATPERRTPGRQSANRQVREALDSAAKDLRDNRSQWTRLALRSPAKAGAKLTSLVVTAVDSRHAALKNRYLDADSVIQKSLESTNAYLRLEGDESLINEVRQAWEEVLASPEGEAALRATEIAITDMPTITTAVSRLATNTLDRSLELH